MPHIKQMANKIRKGLTGEELEKIYRARFDVDKLNYTEEWHFIRKKLESIFDNFRVDVKERDKKTSEVITELKLLLKNERLTDPLEKTFEIKKSTEKSMESVEQDHFDQPEIEKKIERDKERQRERER